MHSVVDFIILFLHTERARGGGEAATKTTETAQQRDNKEPLQ